MHANNESLNEAQAHLLIGAAIRDARPFAMGKLGGTETRAIYHTERFLQIDFIYGLSWIKYGRQLLMLAGVYPLNKRIFHDFAALYKKSVLPSCDFIFAWQNSKKESTLIRKFASQAQTTSGFLQDFVPGSWIQHLAGKRVLVISPFSETVQRQHPKRPQIWQRVPELGVDFELLTLSCPLHSHMVPPVHADWFIALEAMKAGMRQLDYDVLLVGAGAWGLPLATAAKEAGKVGIHMGGNVQLLFGIKGARWDSYPDLYNEHWVYPAESETPKGVENVEGSCYWKPNA
jgi:hypothetical protein